MGEWWWGLFASLEDYVIAMVDFQDRLARLPPEEYDALHTAFCETRSYDAVALQRALARLGATARQARALDPDALTGAGARGGP